MAIPKLYFGKIRDCEVFIFHIAKLYDTFILFKKFKRVTNQMENGVTQM